MLSRTEASQQLQSVERTDWRRTRERAIRRLGGAAGRIAAEIVDTRHVARVGRRATFQATRQMGALKPRQRRRLFETLAPGHGAAVARAWEHVGRGPYQHGWSRRPFRTPGSPENAVVRQAGWLVGVSETIWRYPAANLEWYAAWAPHLGYGTHGLGSIFAAEIDGGPEGNAVLETLLSSLHGEHPIGAMGRHVVTALLGCSRPEAWDIVEKTLLAAQRQEGLRQVILETVDEAHPEAFARMVRLINEENLTRFAAVVRACNVWFGFGLDVSNKKILDAMLAVLAECLQDPSRRHAYLAGSNPQTAYVALWSIAFHDATQVFAPSTELLTTDDASIRLAAAHLLGQIGLDARLPLLLDRLEDRDPAVAWCAFRGLEATSGRLPNRLDVADRLQRYLTRLPSAETLDPTPLHWMPQKTDPDEVLLATLYQLEPDEVLRLGDYLPQMGADVRGTYAFKLAQAASQPEVRTALLQLTGDRSQRVRDHAFEGLARHPVDPAEAPPLEALLTRKTASVRRAVIAMLLTQPDPAVLDSAQRLLESRNAMQREAGLDLLRELAAAERSTDRVREIADRFAADNDLSEQETHLAGVIGHGEEVATLVDCLGLIDPANRTAPPEMTDHSPGFLDDSTAPLLQAADAFVSAHRDMPVRLERAVGTNTQLYGDMYWASLELTVRDEDSVPLTSMWLAWWENEGVRVAGSPVNLVRALALYPRRAGMYISAAAELETWESRLRKTCAADSPYLQYSHQVIRAVDWLAATLLDDEGVSLLLDAAETALARIPDAIRNRRADPPLTRRTTQTRYITSSGTLGGKPDWRSSDVLVWVSLARRMFAAQPDRWSDAAIARLWGIVRWLDEPSAGAPRRRPALSEVVAAFRTGAANDSDVVDHLIGSKEEAGRPGWGPFNDLGQVTRRRPPAFVQETPRFRELIDLVVDRILEVELARGEMPTAASAPALAIRCVRGADRLVQFVSALGRRSLTRGWTWDIQATHSVLSHLIRVSVPAGDDTPERFAELVAAAKLSEAKLLAVAMYAPQWAGFVEYVLGWDGLEESVHWLHAHTKDSKWQVDADIRKLWAAEVAGRTPLSATDLTEGAVDVAWYRRCRNTIGDERWMRLDKVAKYASGGGGHKRAQLYAEALSGTLDEPALRQRIADKRHQDSVRALGLLPIPPEEPQRTDTLVDRYGLVQEFLRGSRKFGSQRRASEKRAAETGVDNLARTAGFADPVRFQWAMETAAVADLAAGPLVVERDPYVVTLSVDEMGNVELTTTKDAKRLKSVPAKYRKDPEIAELRSRKTDLGRQASRMRHSLEAAMVRGDEFSAEELRRLMQHPVLRPMLLRLVWRAAGGNLGYIGEEAASLRRHDGRQLTFGDDSLRIAHPHDLLRSGEWSEWQHECFVAERIQPFKQVFRELYVVTEAELGEGTASRRYAGHQVNPQQAMALLSSRGWVAHPEEGPVKTFHDEGITVGVGVLGGWLTPAEVEGMTLELVVFSKRGEWRPMPLADVPQRLFSETMRDLDLVVSVAHVGGVDPEASASTVEMRRALVAETATLLGLDNVSFAGTHVVVDGSLGSYSIHLGSAVVHQRPGGALCIIPVHSQHRGRLFLPFADDDPKTAEVMSKVVMLAKDKDIKDPTILEQLVG